MGDAASRDAALHSIQACIPHRTILPLGIDRVTPAAGWTYGPARVHATERASDGDNFIYDLRIEDAEGRLREEWDGLHLHAVTSTEVTPPWPPALLVPYLERRVRQILAPAGTRVRMVTAQGQQDQCTIANLVREIFGPAATIVHRPDGKPEIARLTGPYPCISFSRSGEATLLFSAERAAGCDLQKVSHRDSQVWEQLLGAEESALARLLAEMSSVPFDNAATQVWALKESLRKAGCSFSPPICIGSRSPDGWTGFSAGGFKGATFCTQIEGEESAFAFGFVIDNTP
jgi:enediyne polyketide synthase